MADTGQPQLTGPEGDEPARKKVNFMMLRNLHRRVCLIAASRECDISEVMEEAIATTFPIPIEKQVRAADPRTKAKTIGQAMPKLAATTKGRMPQ